jgi:hypothetical protein
MNWPKRLFCKHIFVHYRNIYGDEINHCGGFRSIWKCSICGNWQWRAELEKQ